MTVEVPNPKDVQVGCGDFDEAGNGVVVVAVGGENSIAFPEFGKQFC